MADVGGLDDLKEWLAKRSLAFSDRARAFGLPAPKGVLFVGVQGCGKSLCAKAVARMWEMPLLRFDMGRMFSSLVGSSEENIRRAISVAESIAPVVLWVDEIDKAFSGSQGSANTDGGTTARGEVLLARRQKFAAECFQKAVAEAATDWFDHVVIARIRLYYARVTNALHYLRQALELEPTHGYIWYEMGNCQRALGLAPAAAESYQRCLDVRADYAEAERAQESLSAGSSLLARLRMIFGKRRRP